MRIRMRKKDENEDGDEYAQFFQKKQAYACFFSRCQKFSAANGGQFNGKMGKVQCKGGKYNEMEGNTI